MRPRRRGGGGVHAGTLQVRDRDGVMRYLSVCSGIEAATQAWHPLGGATGLLGDREVLRRPRAPLPRCPEPWRHDTLPEWPDAELDILVGGTPCQSFSVADFARARLTQEVNPCLLPWNCSEVSASLIVWENVPGVLSSHGGRDFGTFRGAGRTRVWVRLPSAGRSVVRTHRFGRAVQRRRRVRCRISWRLATSR